MSTTTKINGHLWNAIVCASRFHFRFGFFNYVVHIRLLKLQTRDDPLGVSTQRYYVGCSGGSEYLESSLQLFQSLLHVALHPFFTTHNGGVRE